MPIYEYRCKKCGSEFELYLKSSKQVPTCPDCGSKSLEKKMSGFVARSAEAHKCACSHGECGRENGDCACKHGASHCHCACGA